MEDISLHLLDIVENSIRAGATKVDIDITVDTGSGLLRLIISDNGEGMDKKTLKRAVDPFFTSKEGKRVGLGISLLSQSAEEAGGECRVDSVPGRGTTITAEFQWDHPDRKPLGDMDSTVQVLKFTHPEIGFSYRNEIGEYK